MPAWISVTNRTVICIGVAVQSLHAGWDDTVRLGKSPQRDVVPACVVEHQAEVCGVGVLSRVGVVRGSHTYTLWKSRFVQGETCSIDITSQ